MNKLIITIKAGNIDKLRFAWNDIVKICAILVFCFIEEIGLAFSLTSHLIEKYMQVTGPTDYYHPKFVFNHKEY